MTREEAVDVPPSWMELDLEQLSGTVLVVGGTDRGKSTLVRWLAARLCHLHRRVGWLDADIGQSSLGLPGTQNLALLEGEAGASPAATFFVGATSPKGNMLPVLTGMKLLQERAWREGAETVVVDTTGLVAPETGGAALKRWTAELLRPAAILALQQGEELEPLLGPWRRERRFALHVLPVSNRVRCRSREQRAERRRQLFQSYFRSAATVEIPIGDLPLYGGELACPNRLLALQDTEGFSLAIGVLREASRERLQVVTPFDRLTEVASVRLGTLKIDPHSGEELP